MKETGHLSKNEPNHPKPPSSNGGGEAPGEGECDRKRREDRDSACAGPQKNTCLLGTYRNSRGDHPSRQRKGREQGTSRKRKGGRKKSV